MFQGSVYWTPPVYERSAVFLFHMQVAIMAVKVSTFWIFLVWDITHIEYSHINEIWESNFLISYNFMALFVNITVL